MVKFEKQVESFAATQELDLEEDADEEYPTVARWVISGFWLRDRGTLGVGWSVCVCPVWLATISYCIENPRTIFKESPKGIAIYTADI